MSLFMRHDEVREVIIQVLKGYKMVTPNTSSPPIHQASSGCPKGLVGNTVALKSSICKLKQNRPHYCMQAHRSELPPLLVNGGKFPFSNKLIKLRGNTHTKLAASKILSHNPWQWGNLKASG